MDMADAQALPVIDYPVDIAYHPDHLGYMMIDGGIQHRRHCLVSHYRSTKRAAPRRRASYSPGGFESSGGQGYAKNGRPSQH